MPLAKMIGPKITSMCPNVGWEVGPGFNQKNVLSITLNGSLENMPYAQKIVAQAPRIPEWDVGVGRQPKKWNGQLELFNSRNRPVLMDASKWRYALTGFQNHAFFDIAIFACWPPLAHALKLRAARTGILNLLGEVVMLERFDRIEVVESPSKADSTRSSEFMDLKNHLEYLASQR